MVEPYKPLYTAFQLTTSHRGRRIICNEIISILEFQLTTSHRGRQESLQTADPAEIFQLTTSHRGRQSFQTKHLPQLNYFNSLPHTEVDQLTMRYLQSHCLFQLTTSHRGRRP